MKEQPNAAAQAGGSPSGEAVPPKDPAQGGSAQAISGQSGPAHQSPQPSNTKAAQGTTQNAPQQSGLSAPVPTAPPSTPKESVLSLEEAQALAEANDVQACQEAARRVRLAGVAVPPPLLALTALDLRFHQGGAAQAETSGEQPAATETQPGAAPAEPPDGAAQPAQAGEPPAQQPQPQ